MYKSATVQINLRIPEDLEAKIQSLAEADRRSFSQMMVILIERGLFAERQALTGELTSRTTSDDHLLPSDQSDPSDQKGSES